MCHTRDAMSRCCRRTAPPPPTHVCHALLTNPWCESVSPSTCPTASTTSTTHCRWVAVEHSRRVTTTTTTVIAATAAAVIAAITATRIASTAAWMVARVMQRQDKTPRWPRKCNQSTATSAVASPHPTPPTTAAVTLLVDLAAAAAAVTTVQAKVAKTTTTSMHDSSNWIAVTVVANHPTPPWLQQPFLLLKAMAMIAVCLSLRSAATPSAEPSTC